MSEQASTDWEGEPRASVPDEIADLLMRPLIAHLATIRSDGWPQVNPVWFRWDGKYVWSTMTTTRQRYKNMTAHPEVALSIVDSDDPYRYLEIRARVVRMLADPLAAEFRRLADRYHVAVDGPVADSSRRIAVALLPTGVSYQLGLPRFDPHTSDSTQQ